MYKVELKINGEHFRNLEVEPATKIIDLIDYKEIESDKIIAYTINREYANSETEIEKNCILNCLYYNTARGHRLYQDTAIFIMMKAFYNLFPDSGKLVIEHSIGDGVFSEIFKGDMITPEECDQLKAEMQRIIDAKLLIETIEVSPEEATEIFERQNRKDILKNLHNRRLKINQCGQYYDHFLNPIAENSSVVRSFDLEYHAPGIILRFPKIGAKKIREKFMMPSKLFKTHQEHDKWLNILNIHNIADLNKAVEEYRVNEIIQIEEALHEKKIVEIANSISSQKDIKIILIAGPSSSGKTTFAKRLSVQLRVNGTIPHIIGMDDYFVSRDRTPRKADGEYDFECINALDLELLNSDLSKILNGEEIEPPKYNFIKGLSERSYQKLKLGQEEVLIMEGIHGLNDRLTQSVPYNQKIKIYVSALNNLNVDHHNRIATSDSRKIRRIMRDSSNRGHSAEQTLLMWNSVQQGEANNIFPYQENADFMFNSILTYELGIFKERLIPHLRKINKYSAAYPEAQRLIELVNQVYAIRDEFVPNNSILREFIGGSIFKY
ncbi:MAG: nucleoside kinase [Candidatus Cloacimonadales bacterium]